jgi:hypothetical protein
MIHSRPGFAPRHSDRVPAKLNADMVPAIHRKPLAENSNLKHGPTDQALDARAAAAMEKLSREHPAPEILVNPVPSEPPKILEPGE